MPIKFHSDSELEYVGKVVKTYQSGGYDWLNEYAVVYSVNENGEYEFETKQVWTDIAYCEGWATVDAPDEVRKAYYKMLQDEQQARIDHYNATALIKGAEVKVVRGRKIPIGTVGRVFWTGPNRFDRGLTKNVGIELEDGSRVFTSELNVERTPQQ